MTRQEAFTTAYQGIIAQGAPGVNPKVGCAYEFNGQHCGIGFIIKPFVTDWEAFHEGQKDAVGVAGLLADKHFKQFGIDFLAEDVGFYDELQAAHDHAYTDARLKEEDFLTSFKERMAIIAKHYRLEVPA